jgi:FkbM family methyltransferase
MSILATLRYVLGHPLNRGRGGAALLRYLKWQVGSRLVPGPILYDWIAGARVVVRPGERGFTGNIYAGLQEFFEMSYLLHVTTQADLFVDVGANVGSYTILACAARGARGYCMEPVPATFARLAENLRVNGLGDRVRSLNIAVGDEDGELALACSDDDCTNHVMRAGESAGEVIRVKSLRLDTILKGESPTLIKIDVEGFESRVLDGARSVLGNDSLHSAIIEMNGSGDRYGFSEDRIVTEMGRFGFKPFSYDPQKRRLDRLEGKNNRSGNTLFVRNEAVVRRKLESAAPFTVFQATL